MNWTDEQLRSIRTTGTSLLVSAAAGSGKTAVLAERCAYLVCDAPDRCDVDELLVVTFTNAAAAEMRTRIEKALRKRQETSDDPRLIRQILMLDRAQITTLHGFCQSVLRRHFHHLGLDPNFRILDEEEVWLLKLDTAREVFDRRYESDSSGAFRRLIDLYGNGNDENVLRRVISLHELMGSVVDPRGWLRSSGEKITEARRAKPLVNSRLGRELAGSVIRWLDDIRARWIAVAGQLERAEGLGPYLDYVSELLAAVDVWRSVFRDGDFDALAAEVAQFDPGELPRFRDPPPEKEKFQALIGAIRKEMRDGPLSEICRFSEQQWREGLSRIHEPTQVFLDLVRDYARLFLDAKRQLRGLDFTDLERFALRILREREEGTDLTPSSVAHLYRSEFKHVLVDEYQDINEVQDAILKLVSREPETAFRDTGVPPVRGNAANQHLSASDSNPHRLKACADNTTRGTGFQAVCATSESAKPSASEAPNTGGTPVSPKARSADSNLFCVGDVKQSIYRFRLAQPARFLNRYERYRADSADGAVIDLSSNFRSRGPLINVINSVFERLMTRDAVEIEYDQSHRLRPGAIYPPAGKGLKPFSGSPVELHLLPPVPRGGSENSDDQDLDRTEREAAFVAKRIGDLMSARHYVADKAPDGSIVYRALQYRDIVVLLRSMKFKSEQFADMLRAAGVPVHTESGTGFFESMEIRDMLSLLRLLDNQQQDLPMAAVLRSPLSGVADAEDSLARIRLAYPHSDEVPFHRAVVKYANEKDDELAAQLRAFLRSLSEWRRLAHQRPLAELIWQIYDSTGYLAFCTGMDDGEQRVANLIDFHERARQFGSFQKQGLSRFMAFLESLAEQSDLGQPSVASEADDVIRVMSIHRSKGLEFPVVIIPDLGKRHNMQDIAGPILVDREAGIGLMVADETLRVRYPSLAHVLVQQRIRKQTLAEEMRVLYVAMTRAREHLILVGSCEEDKPQTWRDQWAAHRGPLPAERILGSLTMLDWIGPAAAAIEGARSADRIEITWHDETEVSQWTTAAVKRREMSDEMRRLARLEPLAPAPATHPHAEQVRQRLTDKYPFREFTQLSAVQSVGSLTKHGRVATGAHSPSREGVVAFDTELSAPRCVLTQTRISATDAGTATHLVLEHLNFARPCDAEDLRAQAAELVRKKLLASELAEAVDLDSIVWLMSTPLGALLRSHAKALRREVPIYFPQSSPEVAGPSDPLDCVMVRGRIDLLIQEGNELTLVDFKTDQVNEQTIDARVEFYNPQLSSYRSAIEAITGMRVRAAKLVFLKAKSIREV